MSLKYRRIWIPVLAALACLTLLWGLDRVFPPALEGKTWSTLVAAKDGTPLRAFADDNGIWRYPVELSDISPLYLTALISYEDRWFYSHPGINPFSFLRAAYQNLTSGRVISGGSTLTMQVARILHPTKRTLAGKVYQICRAIQLEYHLTKDHILTLYANLAPFGSNIEGIQTASYTYLGKDVKELSHAEAALLAVLPQAPSFYRPDRHPSRAAKARDKLLDRLSRFKVWTPQVIADAKNEPVAAFRFSPPLTAPLAARRLYNKNKGKTLITSCLDPDLQLHMEDLLKDYVSGFDREQSGAVMVVNYKTLEVAAYLGSAEFDSASRKGHVDMIQALRSPGSTLKPFLYGLAMDGKLIHSHSLLLDTPRYNQAYSPGNFSNGFSGPVSVSDALRLSLNVPAVQVLEAYGPQKFHDRLKNAGARLKLSGKPNLSMILGGVGTDLESLVRLYTALAREGVSGQPRLTPESPVNDRYLMSPGAAWIVSRILLQPMPGFEGINRLAGHTPMAWKTGTSYGFRDAWAFGIMGDYVAGVWVGRPDGSPSPGQYGAVTALPLLRRVFESLPLSDFSKPAPDTVNKTKICWPLGTKKRHNKGICHQAHDAWILEGQTPLTLTAETQGLNPLVKTFWVNEKEQRAKPSCGGVKKTRVALWPIGAEPWLLPAWKRKNLIPDSSALCSDINTFLKDPIEITSIMNKTVITRPPGQISVPSIELSARGGQGKYHWFLNGNPLTKAENARTVFFDMPQAGRHQLVVADEAGNTDMVMFEVISGAN